MKSIRVAFLVSAIATATAFSQGRVAFANDSLHLVYYDPSFGGGCECN